MFRDLIRVPRHTTCFDFTHLVPSSALSESQTKFLLNKTRADNKDWQPVRITMSCSKFEHPIEGWSKDSRKVYFLKLLKYLAKELLNNRVVYLPVCHI